VNAASPLDGADLARLAIFVGAALAITPLLAAWADALVAHQDHWWRPRCVPLQRWAYVGALTAVFAALASRSQPGIAWWLFAVAGAVFAVVDLSVHELPARLIYPLGGLEALVVLTAGTAHHGANVFARVVLAAGLTALAWMILVLLSPASIGRGDVRLAALGAGLLGWHSLGAALDGQLIAWVQVLAAALVVLAIKRRQAWHTPIPMGPALVIGPLALAAWIG
jgi:leader peptidase (prepilin peptidase)/N-methyltransferase